MFFFKLYAHFTTKCPFLYAFEDYFLNSKLMLESDLRNIVKIYCILLLASWQASRDFSGFSFYHILYHWKWFKVLSFFCLYNIFTLVFISFSLVSQFLLVFLISCFGSICVCECLPVWKEICIINVKCNTKCTCSEIKQELLKK